MKVERILVLMIAAAVLTCAGEQGAPDQSWIHPKAQCMASREQGPYVNLGDGSVLAVGQRHAMVSQDEGKTWKRYRPFKDTSKQLARPERALIRTRDGVIVLAFLNQRELTRGKWQVRDNEQLKRFFLPTYVTRSRDDGKTMKQSAVLVITNP